MNPIAEIMKNIVTVVIVEDSSLVRERLKVLLQIDAPHVAVVGEAEGAQAAIHLIRKRRPDAVILDLQLTGSSGIEVLRVVKRTPHRPVVIVLTNQISFEYERACLEAGAEFFLDKSFGFDRLAGIFRELARKPGPEFNAKDGA